MPSKQDSELINYSTYLSFIMNSLIKQTDINTINGVLSTIKYRFDFLTEYSLGYSEHLILTIKNDSLN